MGQPFSCPMDSEKALDAIVKRVEILIGDRPIYAPSPARAWLQFPVRKARDHASPGMKTATNLSSSKPVKRLFLRCTVWVVTVADVESSRGAIECGTTRLDMLPAPCQQCPIYEAPIARRRHRKVPDWLDFWSGVQQKNR